VVDVMVDVVVDVVVGPATVRKPREVVAHAARRATGAGPDKAGPGS
jgi:hypothetical protein